MSRFDQVLTANEAASVAKVPLKQVHRIIDAGLLAGSVKNRKGTRVILGTGIVGLKLAYVTADILTPDARRRVVRSVLRKPKLRAVRESAVIIDLEPIASSVRDGLGELDRARKMIVSDKEILGGAPCFKGTRIPVHDIADMIGNGDPKAEILKAFPVLNGEQVDAAAIYAAAYPRRGRPRRRPAWHRKPPSSSRRLGPGDLPPDS